VVAALLAAAGAAAVPAAAQQEATIRGGGGEPAGGASGGSGPPASKPRGGAQRRRAARRRNPAPGAPQEAATPEPQAGPRLEAAPVPNRDLEAPRAADGGVRTRLSPSVIHKPLPSQGMAAEGAQSIQEERLFFPAPGARLNVPFSY
jgi:hypothetical protein